MITLCEYPFSAGSHSYFSGKQSLRQGYSYFIKIAPFLIMKTRFCDNLQF